MKWQPIETAPISEPYEPFKPILVWNGKDMWATTADRWKDGYVSWHCHGCAGYEAEDAFENPTHWHPLPEPPDAEATEPSAHR